MNLENRAETREVSGVRITRARAKTLGSSTGILQSSRPSFKQEQKRGILANAKRAALDENKTSAAGAAGFEHKRRAVLKEVTNILCDNVHVNHVRAAKSQNAKHIKKAPAKKSKEVVLDENVKVPMFQKDVKAELAKELSKIRVGESLKLTDLSKQINEGTVNQSLSPSLVNVGDLHPIVETSENPDECIGTSKEDMDCEKPGGASCTGIVDIDSKLKDPQACIPYANDIFKNVRILELDRRPSTNYMETLQQDITPNMRGILIDWLVEVSEEYKLAADTLYLTVNLIDRFLSQNYIEKQRLQLLGVTCMLIASKYEEICAPRVEEFCFITDNTYTKEEVLKMESRVLNLLHFQFSVPTVKPFLRRFIQAAQVSYTESSIELEFLANYLAELTLIEYSFLKFLPSLTAASSIFLARWTLNPSDHPWNPTLEHYTNYKASELKTTVLALEDLQRNTSGCSLNAIREKYRQRKFKFVATLTPKDPVGSLFKD
ncbi:cyclin-A2-1-like [Punica granatum]|uniref:Cyclin-A2-1-like n=1 Tax=Punica granatum TaxID=22663 RepID=A0A6P8ERF1_PUNGR|nr:cyclin-A2-1-like [Punica granatum]XP_031407631.1 cyclin-A2-1-like [Punica granatum]